MSNSPPPASTLNRDANEPVNTQNESISASTLAQSKNELVSDEIKTKKTYEILAADSEKLEKNSTKQIELYEEEKERRKAYRQGN